MRGGQKMSTSWLTPSLMPREVWIAGGGITVTDGDVTNYYNAHKAEFNLIENQYHLAQIQVTGVPAQQAGNLQGSKASTPEEALQKIKALKNRLDSGETQALMGRNFAVGASSSSHASSPLRCASSRGGSSAQK